MRKLAAAFYLASAVIGSYYGYKFGDREHPYYRIFGVVTPQNPAECGGDDGPVPDAIYVGGCNRQEWTVERKRACNVVPGDPVVRRWITDEAGKTVMLPVILSEQVNNIVPRMSKTFIQPDVAPGWVTYRASVKLACPTDAFLLEGKINPMHLLFPIEIDDNTTEYIVKATPPKTQSTP